MYIERGPDLPRLKFNCLIMFLVSLLTSCDNGRCGLGEHYGLLPVGWYLQGISCCELFAICICNINNWILKKYRRNSVHFIQLTGVTFFNLRLPRRKILMHSSYIPYQTPSDYYMFQFIAHYIVDENMKSVKLVFYNLTIVEPY